MNITTEEKLMYDVMKSIYESGIPINFKGSMVLKACLLELGYTEQTRHTVDIDANWNSDDPPTMEQMQESLQKAINKCNFNLRVEIFRKYGEGRSAGFEIWNNESDEILFTMDIDVNRPVPPTKIYEIEGVRFCGVSPSQMIADKVFVLSTDKIFRRIKDMVDLYYLSQVFEFDKADVMNTLQNSGRKLESFNGFLHRINDLQHSYDKFRFEGNVNKPPFDEVYKRVKNFTKDVLPRQRDRDCER